LLTVMVLIGCVFMTTLLFLKESDMSVLNDKRVSEITKNDMQEMFLGPYFGYAVTNTQKAYILHDLPQAAKRFVAAHELYHLDFAKRVVPLEERYKKFGPPVNNMFLHEVSASWAGIKESPVGFLIVVYKTVTSLDRLKLYFKLAWR